MRVLREKHSCSAKSLLILCHTQKSVVTKTHHRPSMDCRNYQSTSMDVLLQWKSMDASSVDALICDYNGHPLVIHGRHIYFQVSMDDTVMTIIHYTSMDAALSVTHQIMPVGPYVIHGCRTLGTHFSEYPWMT